MVITCVLLLADRRHTAINKRRITALILEQISQVLDNQNRFINKV